MGQTIAKVKPNRVLSWEQLRFIKSKVLRVGNHSEKNQQNSTHHWDKDDATPGDGHKSNQLEDSQKPEEQWETDGGNLCLGEHDLTSHDNRISYFVQKGAYPESRAKESPD